jgi:PAS domain S-box-containing protein
MKPQSTENGKLADSMVLAVVLVSTVYWVLDSILNIFFSNKFNLIAQLIGPDLYEVYIRVVVLCLLVILGSHAQSIINRLNQAKQKLNESEELWRSLVETAPDTIMTVDQAGVIRFINHAISGMPPETAVGRRLYDLLPAESREGAEDIVRSVFRTGKTDTFQLCMGEKRNPTWHTFRVGPLQLEHRVIAATIISTDITEFKHAEELIRYKELFDNVGDGVFILGHNGKFIESNGRIEERTGFAQPELAALPLSDLVVPDQAGLVATLLDTARRKNEARCEVNLKTKDGAAIPFEINCRFVVYLGKPCFLCVARETTQTKLLQDQLVRSARLAATGQLAASIAHEINSPLQGISALLNVMRTAYDSDESLKRKLDLVKGAFNSIRDTVKNLIDLNRPGKEQKQPTDVNQVVENTAALVRSLLLKNMITAEVELAAKDSTFIASPQQLGQVLMNLVNNSVEAITGMPEYGKRTQLSSGAGGRIAIRTFNRDNEFVVELKDSGPGIPDADLNRIFDPFFTSKKPMGMGVGLAICQGVIEDHHGKITVANAPEGGAVFTITLPMRQEQRDNRKAEN